MVGAYCDPVSWRGYLVQHHGAENSIIIIIIIIIKSEIKELQKTAILGTAHKLQEVLM